MADPKRWLDDANAPDESLSLLRSLDAPRPYSEAAHLRIASKVSATTANAPAAAAASKVAPLKLIAISGAAVVGTIALVVSFGRSEPPAPPRESRPVVAAPTPALAPAPAPPSLLEVTESAPTAKAEGKLPPRTSPRDDLAVEETLLEQARKASSPARALALLREHERRFPQGLLSAERLFLSGKVNAESGNQPAARRHAAELERRFPASSYVARLRVIVAERFPEKKP